MALGTPVAAVAAYSAAAGATSVAPAYPAGIVATDALILVVGQKPTAANGGTVTTPTGWTLRDELTAAGGYGTTIGADSGNTNLRVYTKNTVAGTETGTLAVTLAGSNIAWAFIVRVPSNGGTLSYGSADGQRTTAPTVNTPFAVALTNSASATAFANGDVAIWAMCIPTDVTTPTQFSAQSITATGATFSAATELNEPDNSTGNDIGGYSAWARVTAGSSAVAPTVTVTAGGTVTNVRGPIVLLRVRETLPTSTGTFSATESGPDGFDARLQAPKLGAVAYSVATPTTIAVSYPSGIAANDALVLFVAVKGSTEGIGSIQAAPSGWTEQCLLFAQGGYPSNIASLDAGNVQLAVYTKNDVSGNESGSVNVALNDSNIAWAIIARYPSAPQRKPDFFAFATGQTSFVTGDTNVPRGTNLGPIFGNGRQALAADDVILFVGAIPTSAYAPNLFSGHSFFPNPITFGPTKQIAEYATNTATHIGGFFAWADVRSSDYALDDINLYSLVYIGEYAFSVGGALTALRIRQKPFFQGSLNASETESDTFAGRPPRPDLGTRTGALAATESPDRLTDGFGDSVYGYTTPPPTIGAVAYSATNTISPAYPAGIAANSIIVMFVAQKPSTANGGTITTPAGWTLQGQSLAGGGYGTTLGIDTGNQNIWVFTKTTVTGTETGTVAVTLATTNSAWAAITSVQRSNSHPLSFLSFAGESITPSTFFSSVNYPIVPNPGDRTDVKIGDIILFGASLASDNGTPTNFSEFSINDNFGLSLYTGIAELAEPDSAGGSDIGGLVAWGKCVSSSGALNSYFEINGLVVDTTNSAGPTVALRIRVEYPPATGNLAATEAADSLSGSGSVVAAGVTGNASATETVKDALSVSGRVIVRGVLSVTDTADALAANGKLIVRGALAVAETGVDAAAAIGKVRVNGALAALESGTDVLAANGKVAVKGSLTAAETGVDTLISNGGAVSQGSFSVIEAIPDAIAGSGSVLVKGDLEVAEQASDAAQLAGVLLVAGALAAQETGADTFVAEGPDVAAGYAAIVETSQDLLAVQGGVQVTGIAAIVDASQDAVQSTGVVLVRGALSALETATDTFAASGGKLTSGYLSAVDELDAASGSGRLIVTGYGVGYETGVDAGNGSGNVVVQGVASILDLVSDSAQATGQIFVRGDASSVEALADTMKGGIVIGFALSGRTQSRIEAQQSRPVNFESSREPVASATRGTGPRSRPAKNTASR